MTSNSIVDPIETEAAAVAEIAAQIGRPISVAPGDIQRFVVPEGSGSARVLTFDGEEFSDAPRRKRGTATFHDVTSFLEYSVVHWTDGSACWVDTAVPSIVAVLNGDGPGRPGWGDHRARFAPRPHREWNAWAQVEAKGWIAQGDLADFIQQWLHTIVEPDGATLLELAQEFQATIAAKFQSGARLASGARQLVYTEDVAAKSGSVEIPESFTVQVTPMEGADPVLMRVWLRFRVRDGALSFRLLRDRADDILEANIVANAGTVADRLDPVYFGTPS
jgi:uncharacterized protein YfdQ (DUF2303 family)